MLLFLDRIHDHLWGYHLTISAVYALYLVAPGYPFHLERQLAQVHFRNNDAPDSVPGASSGSSVGDYDGIDRFCVILFPQEDVVQVARDLALNPFDPWVNLVQPLGRVTHRIVEQPSDVVAVARAKAGHSRYVANSVAVRLVPLRWHVGAHALQASYAVLVGQFYLLAHVADHLVQ